MVPFGFCAKLIAVKPIRSSQNFYCLVTKLYANDEITRFDGSIQRNVKKIQNHCTLINIPDLQNCCQLLYTYFVFFKFNATLHRKCTIYVRRTFFLDKKNLLYRAAPGQHLFNHNGHDLAQYCPMPHISCNQSINQ